MANKYYTVKQGETILNCVLNSTGSLSNWGLIIDANGWDTWTPQLTAGQQILIPDTISKQTNIQLIFQTYPLCDNMSLNILNQINNFVNKLSTFYLLLEDTNYILLENGGKIILEN